ncbi:MAG TPA: WYL domain-containing protein [Oculatellaceae cyanobacterium]
MTKMQRVAIIVKTIGSQPGITLKKLLCTLHEEGIKISEETLTTDIQVLKLTGLLPQDRRLRNGYYLQGMHTIGTEEISTVIDALWTFGFNLGDKTAFDISNRLGATSRIIALREKNIYREIPEELNFEHKMSAAIKDHLAVEITLESPRLAKPSCFRTFPLFKLFHERGWYLVTRNVDRREFFASRIDRIKECELLLTEINQIHERDVNDAQFLLNAGWGMDFPHTIEEFQSIESLPEIVVRFDSTVAVFIKEGAKRHPRAKISNAPDGSGHLDFSIKLKYHTAFRNWVRSWGSKAWFLEPQAIVDEEQTDLRRQFSNYAKLKQIPPD